MNQESCFDISHARTIKIRSNKMELGYDSFLPGSYASSGLNTSQALIKGLKKF